MAENTTRKKILDAFGRGLDAVEKSGEKNPVSKADILEALGRDLDKGDERKSKRILKVLKELDELDNKKAEAEREDIVEELKRYPEQVKNRYKEMDKEIFEVLDGIVAEGKKWQAMAKEAIKQRDEARQKLSKLRKK